MDREAIRALPKAELHIHLESAIPQRSAAALAERNGVTPPPLGPFANQAEFVVAYERARDLIVTIDDLREVARALGERQRGCGVVWSEVHFAPTTYAARLVPDDALVEAVVDGLRSGAGPGGAGVILGINRGLGLEPAQRTLDLALRWAGRGVVALGFAGDEAAHPAAAFAAVFERARAAGLPFVPHAGEIPRPEVVATALDLRPPRIAHGLAAARDPALVGRLAEAGVCLDLAPSSNVLLGLVDSLAEHPLPTLLDAGVAVTLSTDIPLFLGFDLVEEYIRCQHAWGLPDDRVRELAANSLDHALWPQRCRVNSPAAPPPA